MRLREVLSVLSKSSPYAVKTEREVEPSSALDGVKNYLYIETDIESDFRKELESLSYQQKKVIFLCEWIKGEGQVVLMPHEKDNRLIQYLPPTYPRQSNYLGRPCI